jgi:hypothetical protein
LETITAGRWKAIALTAIAGPDNVSRSKQLEHPGAAPFTIVVTRFHVIVSTPDPGPRPCRVEARRLGAYLRPDADA